MLMATVASELEEKVAYYTATGGHDYSGSVSNLLTNMTRGDTAINNYTGNSIDPKWIRLRYVWSSNQIFNTCRLILFQWKDSSVPVAASLLAITGSAEAPLSYLRSDNRNIFKVLYDETLQLGAGGDGGLGYDSQTRIVTVQGKELGKFNVDPDDTIKYQRSITSGLLPVEFNQSNNTVIENGIYLLSISDDGVASYPQLAITAEIWYTDA